MVRRSSKRLAARLKVMASMNASSPSSAATIPPTAPSVSCSARRCRHRPSRYPSSTATMIVTTDPTNTAHSGTTSIADVCGNMHRPPVCARGERSIVQTLAHALAERS
jgi:hypothetical protein